MFVPDLSTWIEEGNFNSGLWIDSHGPVQFGQIACGAGQCAIAQSIRTAMRLGDNVFDVIAMATHTLWCVTILTAPAGTLLDVLAEKCGG